MSRCSSNKKKRVTFRACWFVFGGGGRSNDFHFHLSIFRGPRINDAQHATKQDDIQDVAYWRPPRFHMNHQDPFAAAFRASLRGHMFFYQLKPPEKTKMDATKTWRFGRWFSFSKVWFSGEPAVSFLGVTSKTMLMEEILHHLMATTTPRNSSAIGNTSTLMIEVAERKPWKGNTLW